MLVARVVFDLLFFSALIRFVHYSHDSPFLFSFCRPFFSLAPLTLPLILPFSWRPIPPCCAHRTFALFYRIVCFNYSFCVCVCARVCASEWVCNFFVSGTVDLLWMFFGIFCPFSRCGVPIHCGKNRMCDVIKCLFMHLAQNDLYLVQRVFNFD